MTTRAFSLNPHRRPAIGEDAPGTPTHRALVLGIAGLWTAALALASVGLRVGTGAWPAGLDEAVFLPLLTGVLALPVSLVRTWGAFVGVAVFALALLFWPLVLGLQVVAAYRRRWAYLVPVAVLLALAAWNWIDVARSMMSI